MKDKAEAHLDVDQLSRAVVDVDDLPPSLREHLATCPQCRQAKERFELELSGLGEMARRLAPSARTALALPEEQSPSTPGWSWKRRTAYGMALAVLLVVLVSWQSDLVLFAPGENGDNPALVIQSAEDLIAEVNLLVANPLPQVYLEICAESELDFVESFDEVFFELVVPVKQDDPVSLRPAKKGELLC